MQNVITAARNQLQQLQAPVVAPVASNPIDKILSNKTPQQNPLDLLNSITKLFPKTEVKSEQKQDESASTTNISINEILNILKLQKPEVKIAESKPSLLPTPTAPLKRKSDDKQEVKKIPLLPSPPQGKHESIIKVKNFPHTSSYKDIRSFLQGIQIEHNGIRFIDKGQAYVKLLSLVDLKKALCRNGQYFEDKQIEVSQATDNDTNKRESPKQDGGFFIKIYGLPANFDDSALKNMFNNVKFNRIITSNPTPIQSKVTNQDGSHETKTIIKAKKLCEVDTQLDVERALTRQDERVGKSKIQIFQISRGEFEREISTIKHSDGDEIENDGDDGEEEDEEYFVHITGIPFTARLDDVRDFLGGINSKEINILYDPVSQKPSGDCVCEFYTRYDRDKALSRTDSLFRNRNVRVKPVSPNEGRRLIREKKLKSGKAPRPALLPTPPSPTEKHDDSTGHKRPYHQTNYQSNKRPKQASPVRIDLPPLPAELQKYRNSIVLLSNVAYEATREDILELFKYYSPIEQTLKIRHDDRGQPTGDAIVACRSHDEAFKACKSLDGTDFMGRSIRAVLISP